jgi:hypothetical protein
MLAFHAEGVLMKTRPRTGSALSVITKLIVASLLVALVGAATARSSQSNVAMAVSNSDAAHECQNGGYADLTGVSSTGQYIYFSNEGACVSFAAHGGQFVYPMLPCTINYSQFVGCFTVNTMKLSSFTGTGNTLTLTGAISFYDGCNSPCTYPTTPPAAVGGGSYVLKNASGTITSQGEFKASTLYQTSFVQSDGATPTTCPNAAYRTAGFVVTLTDMNTNQSTTDYVLATTNTSANSSSVASSGNYPAGVSDMFFAAAPGSMISC